MMKRMYLRDIAKDVGFPFLVRKITHAPRTCPFKDFELLPITEGFYYRVAGRNRDGTFRVLDVLGISNGGEFSDVMDVIDTKAYTDPAPVIMGKWHALICNTAIVDKALNIVSDQLEHRTLAPLSQRHEYVATRAFFLWEEGMPGSDLDRWLTAERWIDGRYIFLPKGKLRRYM